MKKITSIFLLIVLCFTYLSKISGLINLSTRYNQEISKLGKKFSSEKEVESQKESKIKEITEEQEKFFSRDHYFGSNNFQLSEKDKFVCTNTILNAHPITEHLLQPPNAV